MTFVRLRACHTCTKTFPAIVMGDAPDNYRPFAHVPNEGDPAEANRYAALFAAAPELLAGLRDLLPYAENEALSLDALGRGDDRCAEQARAAWAVIEHVQALIDRLEADGRRLPDGGQP